MMLDRMEQLEKSINIYNKKIEKWGGLEEDRNKVDEMRKEYIACGHSIMDIFYKDNIGYYIRDVEVRELEKELEVISGWDGECYFRKEDIENNILSEIRKRKVSKEEIIDILDKIEDKLECKLDGKKEELYDNIIEISNMIIEYGNFKRVDIDKREEIGYSIEVIKKYMRNKNEFMKRIIRGVV